jgi:divalent metal cation (Fe/Co/Zn/Cd) transporter
MLVELIGSIGVGLIARSLALLAFGGDSLIEIFSGVAVLTHLRSGRESGASGGSGREKTELITSVLLFLLIPVIGLGAAYSYLTGLRPEGSPLGVGIAIGAVVVMPYLYLEKRRIGEETLTPVLSMDAIESLTCFFMSVALLGGLLAEYYFHFWWADYVATLAILVFVAREAVESLHELRTPRSNSESQV